MSHWRIGLIKRKRFDMYARLLSATSLCCALAGCGGGGGSSPPPPTAAPTGVTATAGDSYILLDGNPVAGATAYNIYWATAPGVTKLNGTKLAVSSTPQAHTALTNGQPYYYVVTAVDANGESAESNQVSATPSALNTGNDPLFADQWNLLNTGQLGASGVAAAGQDINVQPAWATTKGAGVRIAIVDDGLEMAHEDLASNLAANGQSHNYLTGTSDPTNDATDTTSGHGTSVAGIVAARDSNGLGGSGVAPRATLIGYGLLLNTTTTNEADAMSRNVATIDVFSNSWGPPDGTGNITASPTLWQSAIDTGLATGRGGKGTVYVWAAGNGRAGASACPTCEDNSNYDGHANYHGVMAVAAVNDQGVQTAYSESGANVWVSAPGGDYCDTHTITTTDRTGNVGTNTSATAGVTDYTDQKYTKCMNGTSSATPTIAGVVALMLATNPALTWRDVRIILAQTARMNDSAGGGWILNWGTPRYYVSHKYGFGVVDAAAAVTAAQGWVNVAAEKTPHTTAVATPSLSIPDNDPAGVSHVIPVTGSGIASIEFVEVTFSAADHTYAGDLDITLTSPTGTISQLATRHMCSPGGAGSCTAYSSWVFGSAQHLGEAADGSWTLTVKDLGLNDIGTFQSWKLKFYGH